MDLILESKYKNAKKHVFEWVETILRKLEITNPELFRNVFDYILEKLRDLVKKEKKIKF